MPPPGLTPPSTAGPAVSEDPPPPQATPANSPQQQGRARSTSSGSAMMNTRARHGLSTDDTGVVTAIIPRQAVPARQPHAWPTPHKNRRSNRQIPDFAEPLRTSRADGFSCRFLPPLFASVPICLLRRGGQRRSGERLVARVPLLRLIGLFLSQGVFHRHTTPRVFLFSVTSTPLAVAENYSPTTSRRRRTRRCADGS